MGAPVLRSKIVEATLLRVAEQRPAICELHQYQEHRRSPRHPSSGTMEREAAVGRKGVQCAVQCLGEIKQCCRSCSLTEHNLSVNSMLRNVYAFRICVNGGSL